jgi:hypothetical protein
MAEVLALFVPRQLAAPPLPAADGSPAPPLTSDTDSTLPVPSLSVTMAGTGVVKILLLTGAALLVRVANPQTVLMQLTSWLRKKRRDRLNFLSWFLRWVTAQSKAGGWKVHLEKVGVACRRLEEEAEAERTSHDQRAIDEVAEFDVRVEEPGGGPVSQLGAEQRLADIEEAPPADSGTEEPDEK